MGQLDPAFFNDPLALKTDWAPLEPGGANFKTAALVEKPDGQLSFQASTAYVLFGLVFLVAGVLTFAVVAAAGSAWALFGVPFAGIGLYVLLHRPARTFDPQARQAVIGKRTVPFTSLVAVQIVRELVEQSEGPDYYSYELNLVLADGSRLNVIDHGKLAAVRSDAARVAACVGCKVWDGPLAQGE